MPCHMIPPQFSIPPQYLSFLYVIKSALDVIPSKMWMDTEAAGEDDGLHVYTPLSVSKKLLINFYKMNIKEEAQDLFGPLFGSARSCESSGRAGS